MQPANARRLTPALIVLGLVVVTALGLRLYHAWQDRRIILAEATLKGRVFVVEVADTEAKRELGLGKREALPADRGMYFPFASAQHWIFWMKDMRFPIDIIWIRDGKVVDIDARVPVPAGEQLETFSPAEPADAVLELNAGVAEEVGLARRDEITLRAEP